MTYQLVPPHDHQRNKAEKVIQTFKDHIIAILCGANTSFPLNLWDLLLSQAEHTLNMLRPSQMTPTVSAYAFPFGGNMITTQTLLLPWDARLNHIWYPAFARHERPTQQADTTLERHGNIIVATKYISLTPATPEFAAWYFSSTNISPCHP
jgi:hypothetical protein